MDNAISKFDGYYRFLSNFYICKPAITYNHIRFDTSEFAFQFQKTDRTEKTYIDWMNSGAEDPDYAKYLGRHVKLREGWSQDKVEIMYEILLEKFSNDRLRIMLLDTSDKVLIEGNTWRDSYWGFDIKANRGENILGILLMAIRHIFGKNLIDFVSKAYLADMENNKYLKMSFTEMVEDVAFDGYQYFMNRLNDDFELAYAFALKAKNYFQSKEK